MRIIAHHRGVVARDRRIFARDRGIVARGIAYIRVKAHHQVVAHNCGIVVRQCCIGLALDIKL